MSSLHAAAVRIELHINESQSLKAKRSVLRPLLARLEKLHLSVAEVDNQDSWQVATIAVAVVAADAGLPVAEYGPNEVKIAVTGMGNADKEQVRRALVKVHGLKEVPVQADAADAVAVALTHLVGARLRSLARLGSR